jgi:hypothetical protein
MTARQFIRGQLPKPTVSAAAGYGGGGQKNNREAGGPIAFRSIGVARLAE